MCTTFVHEIGTLVDKPWLQHNFVHGIGTLVDKPWFQHNFVHEIGILVDKLWLHPSHTKKPVYSLVSGKSLVFPDEVGRTSVSIREIASFSGQGWSEGFLRSAQPLRSEGHWICRMVHRWPNATLSTKLAFWWTNRSLSTTLSTELAFWWTNRGSNTTLSTGLLPH